MLGIALALGSSLSWGVSDFIGGLQARRLPLLRVMIVSQSVGLAAVVAAVVIRGRGAPGVSHLLPAAAGGVLGVVGLTAFYRALAIGTMSIVAPIAATGVCLPVLAGIINGERPAAVQLVGIGAAIAGVVLASREPDPDAPVAGRQAKASVLLALVAAVGFGSFAVGLRAGARADVLWALLSARGAGFALILVAFLARRPARSDAGAPIAPLVLMGILDLAANGLYALATRHGLLSVVAVAASLYPLITVLLARSLLGERVHRVQEIGIVAALAGVVLIAVG